MLCAGWPDVPDHLRRTQQHVFRQEHQGLPRRFDQFRNSSSNAKFQVYKSTQQEVEEFYRLLTECLTRPSQAAMFEDIVALYKRVQNGYAAELQKLYRQKANHQLTEIDISTLINFNREFFAAYKAMVWAIKDYLLEKEQAGFFAELPGFIR